AVDERRNTFAFAQRKGCRITRLYEVGEIFGATRRHKLIVGIMVVGAVAEPKTARIGFELRPFVATFIRLRVIENGLERFTDGEVVFTALVVDDIPAGQCGPVEVIGQLFLLEGEGIESRHLVPEDFEVGKGVDRYGRSLTVGRRAAFGRLARLG